MIPAVTCYSRLSQRYKSNRMASSCNTIPAQKQSLLIISSILLRLVGEMNAVMSPSLQFARISISPDTKRLDNVAYWLASWESSLEDFYKGNRIQAKNVRLQS